jgi:hypothetical protein
MEIVFKANNLFLGFEGGREYDPGEGTEVSANDYSSIGECANACRAFEWCFGFLYEGTNCKFYSSDFHTTDYENLKEFAFYFKSDVYNRTDKGAHENSPEGYSYDPEGYYDYAFQSPMGENLTINECASLCNTTPQCEGFKYLLPDEGLNGPNCLLHASSDFNSFNYGNLLNFDTYLKSQGNGDGGEDFGLIIEREGTTPFPVFWKWVIFILGLFFLVGLILK